MLTSAILGPFDRSDSMPARMTPTAWSRGMGNAAFCGAMFLSGWWLTAILTAIVSRRPLADSYWIAYAVLWGLIFSLFLGTWLSGRKAGGGVLLDYGPHPARVLFLIYAALFLVMGLLSGFSARWLPTPFRVAGPVFGITFGAYWLIMASGRLQVRRDGLWQYWGLLRWEKIECCRWAGDSTLVVQAKFPSDSSAGVPCPSRRRTSRPSMNCCGSTARPGIVTSDPL